MPIRHILSHLGSNTEAATLWKAAAAGMRHRSEAKHSTDWEWANWAAKAEEGLGRDLQNSKKKRHWLVGSDPW